MENENKQMVTVGEGTAMVVLFDLDGVLMDTEKQYTEFWNRMGREFLNDAGLGSRIKGTTLQSIYSGYFTGRPDVQALVSDRLSEFEFFMHYDYCAGAEMLLKALREAAIPTALVTSSNQDKMRHVHRNHPEFTDYFDAIITAEQMKRSKPAPDGFLLAMEQLAVKPEQTVIFEDSLSGLRAARASGATVIALSGTIGREKAETESDLVIDSLEEIDIALLQELLNKNAE